MSVYKSILLFMNLFFIINLVQCTEFVPVYMWSTSKANEKVPALHKISQDSFKDDVLERLKEDPFVIVFAEQTLSPEDFAQHDQSGGIAFPNLSKLKKASKISYLPYVQNPVKALKHLDEDVIELSIASLRQKLVIPKTNILIVDLNDAKDDEHRLDMLKRHDADIKLIYEEILKKHDNVLALYTAHHTSWVAPEDIVSSRKIRSLLAIQQLQEFNQLNHTIVYLTNATFVVDNRFILTNQTSDGYWELVNVTAFNNSTQYNLTSSSAIYAPMRFSYHCGDQLFTDKNFEVYLKSFQIQPFFGSVNISSKFSDAYDCVGFTSVPIWSGIFVTSILLLIMTFGIIMMMDIRTMDRFDDAKGKTITINAE
ncbi:hypothetical protein NQ314_013124 [Rhamnusium bicolor]|uniref:V-type proton ATPase subunit S1 n=1 Tax=Rhamnusium bicolor TaxID=1586634 RepID=A0AAV8X7R8_9CUCU|nr:hypothetical protein NQ314_013124 [Rhamnusium bicolor]